MARRIGPPSYLDKLRTKEISINNPRDAEMLFRKLKNDSPEQLVLNCDEKLLPVLVDAIEIIHPNIEPVLELLDKFSTEKLVTGCSIEKS
jgi:hypothetical protein